MCVGCSWNRLDIAIVILSIIGIILEEIESGFIPINPTIIRAMRVLRIARGTFITKCITRHSVHLLVIEFCEVICPTCLILAYKEHALQFKGFVFQSQISFQSVLVSFMAA